MLWPNNHSLFDSYAGYGTVLRLKAEAHDIDGMVSEVRFFAETNLIGVVTRPPYSIVWDTTGASELGTQAPHIRVIAVDDCGAVGQSESVLFLVHSGLPSQIVRITSPDDQSMFAAPATFNFTAEVLGTFLGVGAIDFYLGSNAVGRVDYGQERLTSTSPPPATITISNLDQGEYDLYLRSRSTGLAECDSCCFFTNHIRVTRLGLQSLPSIPGEPFQFDVITSFTNRLNVIERSVDLRQWTSIATNRPSTNRFRYMDSSRPTTSQMFYRVVAPPE